MRRRTLVRARLGLVIAAMVLVVGVIAGGTAAKTSGPQAAKSQQATTINRGRGSLSDQWPASGQPIARINPPTKVAMNPADCGRCSVFTP